MIDEYYTKCQSVQYTFITIISIHDFYWYWSHFKNERLIKKVNIWFKIISAILLLTIYIINFQDIKLLWFIILYKLNLMTLFNSLLGEEEEN